MSEDCLDLLLKAFALESRLAARAEVLSTAARADGQEHLALVLEAQAASRQVRARRLLRLARGKILRGREAMLDSVRLDLNQAAGMYHDLPGDAPAGLEHGARVEKLMPAMLERAAKKGKSDPPLSYAVCQVCGFTKTGEAPERCPVCGALKSKFTTLDKSPPVDKIGPGRVRW